MELKNTRLADLFKSAAESLVPQLSIWRRHLHSHPELSYEEYETMKYVSDELDKMGVPHTSGIADTGIVATIESNDPTLRFMALRADLDALPIQELNDVPYASCNPGVMHACGHDVHTTSLLGAAHILSKNKDQWTGTVRLIFQPGEEQLPGGASLMVAEGVLKNPVPSHILGSHVFPELPAGHVGMRPGTYMASADEIHLTIVGKGGHAALPENQSNPLIVASEIILALEKFMNERPDPSIKTVLAFGFIEGLGATNVIPNEVHLKGTFRSLNEIWRYEVHKKIKSIVEEICQKRDAKADLRIPVGYPSVYNDPDLTARMKSSAIAFLGEEKVHDLPVRMTAEDFSFYAREIPGCFYRIGTSSPISDLGHSGLHTPYFDVDEDALKLGAGLMAFAAATT
ncbi:MAG: M20 family metallopeptidase [Flavobacteriales bacterium]|nr:M20 family metallopeptidase [Flavobacteriales bacterium]